MTTTWQPQEPAALRMQLVDVMNHELRTPLTALLGHAEVLQELDLPLEAMASVTSIVRAGERLRDLAWKVTAVADAHSRVGRAVPGQCDLAVLGRAVVAEQTARVAARGLTFRWSRSAPHAVAFVDEQLVREAAVALVQHAVQRARAGSTDPATPSGSVVEVGADAYDDVAALTVRVARADVADRAEASALIPFRDLDAPVPARGRDVVELVLAEAVAAAHGGSLLVSAGDDVVLRLELPRGLRLAA
jgi:signal transduction histidine kinase